MQKIALILAAVGTTQQAPPPAAMRNPRVVTGGDAFGAQRLGRIQEMLELHFAVAQHVRIGRASGCVFGQKMLEHAAPVLAGKIAEVERNTEHPAHRHRIAAIILGAAIAAAVIGPVLHEQPGDRLALLGKPPGCHRRIHAT